MCANNEGPGETAWMPGAGSRTKQQTDQAEPVSYSGYVNEIKECTEGAKPFPLIK